MLIASVLLNISILLPIPDEIVFKNGEKIVGKITAVADGKITIQSDSLGTVSAPLDKVSTFSADHDLTIVLKESKTVINQKIAADTDGKFKLAEGGALQPQSIAIADIDKINPPPVKWEGNIVAGYTATRGNTDTDTANIDFNTQRRSDNDRIRFGAGYVHGRQKNDTTHKFETTARRVFGMLQYDYFFSKVHYIYVNGKAEKDGIAQLDLRFIAGAGAGQQWVESDTFNFNTEEGVAWISENYSNATPAVDQITGRLAYHVDGKPFDGVKLFHNFEYYPSFEEKNDALVFADAGIRSSLTSSMFAEAKAEVRYDTTPALGSTKTDTRYIFGIGWSF
ncbi:MAG: YdiY family protein [Planctomycetota bacterium]